MSSIRTFLLLTLITLFLITGIITAIVNYMSISEEIQEVFDAEMLQVAGVLHNLVNDELNAAGSAKYQSPRIIKDAFFENKTIDDSAFKSLGADEDEHSMPLSKYDKTLAFQVWNNKGGLKVQSELALELNLKQAAQGWSSQRLGRDIWRVLTVEDPQRDLWVQVAQRVQTRNEESQEVAFTSLLPSIALIPFIGLFVWLLVGRGLRPIRDISAELKQRDYSNLHHLSKNNTPDELHVLVQSLNELFDRVQEAAERERRFTADAAHELRTPLAGTKIQLQNAQRLAETEQGQTAINKSLIGLERLIKIVEQLLLLSRLDHEETMTDSVNVDIGQLVEEVLSSYRREAAEKKVTVKVHAEKGSIVRGNENSLHILIRNLIDNAIRYTLDGTCILVNVNNFTLSVIDEGPGVPEEQLPYLFKRFSRGVEVRQKGSGLGLSICKQIVNIHKGHIDIYNRQDGKTGTVAQLTFKELSPKYHP